MPSALDWNQVPNDLRYVQPWADKYGLRGLTVYFQKVPLAKWATQHEVVELRSAYETIAQRGDADAISAWCLSIRSKDAANDVKEHVRGLLLLFERLAEYQLPPFADGRVRYNVPDPPAFDWSVLPPHLDHWKPWLKRFERLVTEWDLFEFVRQASHDEVRELAELKKQIDRNGRELIDWLETANAEGNPAKREAFQAEWLFLLVNFAKSRIRKLRKP